MDIVMAVIRFLIYNLMGFYVLNIIMGEHSVFKGLNCPFYGIFGIICENYTSLRLPEIFILGAISALLINLLFGLIDKKLMININSLYFGLFALIHVFIIKKLVDAFLGASNILSIVVLMLILGIPFLIDMSISLREMV